MSNSAFNQTPNSAGATPALDNLSSVAINTALLLGTSDAAALGSATKQWSDLFLAEGGVINWDNGDATITQTNNIVLLAGATLETSTVGTAANSVTTIDGTQTLTNKTLSSATNVYRAASLTTDGSVELATTAEINTGTDTTRAIPIDQYVASNRNVRYFLYRCVGDTTDWPADATTKVGGDIEFPFTGTITEIGAYVDTAGTTGTAIVDVNLGGATIMTTNKLKWDSTEKSTRTYSGTAPGLTTTAITAGDIITVDVDTNHTTKSKGLTLRLGVRLS